MVDMCWAALRSSSGHRAAACSAPQLHLRHLRRTRNVVAHCAVRGRPQQRSQRSRFEGRTGTALRPTWHAPGGSAARRGWARCIMGVVHGRIEGRCELLSSDDLRVARSHFDSTPIQPTPSAVGSHIVPSSLQWFRLLEMFAAIFCSVWRKRFCAGATAGASVGRRMCGDGQGQIFLGLSAGPCWRRRCWGPACTAQALKVARGGHTSAFWRQRASAAVGALRSEAPARSPTNRTAKPHV